MSTVDQFLDALAAVESSNNPQAWGDGGRAMGRWQVHPDRLWFEANRYGREPELGETWDSFVRRVLESIYYSLLETREPRELAMYWHVGHWTAPDRPDWD